MNDTAGRELATHLDGTKLTQAQGGLLRAVTEKEHLPIDEVADRMNDVRVLITRGYLRLAANVYPWGIDFELEPGYDGGSQNGGS